MNEDIFISITSPGYSTFFQKEHISDSVGIFLSKSEPYRLENSNSDIVNPVMPRVSGLLGWTIKESEDRVRFAKGETFNFREYPKNSINPTKPIRVSRLW